MRILRNNCLRMSKTVENLHNTQVKRSVNHLKIPYNFDLNGQRTHNLKKLSKQFKCFKNTKNMTKQNFCALTPGEKLYKSY